jgi:hypothetical protein
MLRARAELLLVVGMLSFCALCERAGAQTSSIAKAAAKEIVETIVAQAEKQGAKSLARELAEFGGETAVRETLEQVEKQGGEKAVQAIVRLGKTCGIDALRAAKTSPRLTAELVEQVRPELAAAALRTLARADEAIILGRIPQTLAPAALEAAARHPGVGAQLVEKLGAEGIDLSKRLTTDEAIGLLRHAGDIAPLPSAERAGLLKAVGEAPGKVISYMGKHPKVLLTTAGVGLFLANKDRLLGGKGSIEIAPDGTPVYVPAPGIIERVIITPVMQRLLPVAALLLAMWGLSRIYWSWRSSRLSYQVKRCRH